MVESQTIEHKIKDTKRNIPFILYYKHLNQDTKKYYYYVEYNSGSACGTHAVSTPATSNDFITLLGKVFSEDYSNYPTLDLINCDSDDNTIILSKKGYEPFNYLENTIFLNALKKTSSH